MELTFQHGSSQTAEFIQSQISNCERALHKSAVSGVESLVRGELADVWEECSQPDWDGYGAFPVTWDSYNLAVQFLRSLPLGAPLPSIGAEPDGHVTLDWGRSPRRQLSISCGPDGDLHYAALIGPGRRCGTEPFVGEIPEAILDLIQQVY